MNAPRKILTAIAFALTMVVAIDARILCAQIKLPAIDPSGNRIFLPAPNSTTLLGPFHSTSSKSRGLFSHERTNTTDAYPRNHSSWIGSHTRSDAATPAFTHPNAVPPCGQGPGKHVIPKPDLFTKKGNPGQILLTPSRIIAPVGSEVVVLAGICGGEGTFDINQPLEYMLSNDSVGQIIEVGGMEHPNFNRMVAPSSKKFDGQYAWGRTGLKEKTITRGTPTPCDDIEVLKGQTYLSLSSASAGTTYLTAVAPKATGWDRRRASTIIHWVDGVWSIPTPIKTTSGSVQPLTTTVSRVSDGGGIANWKVRYTIVDGAPAEFAPTGSQQAELNTNTDGQATVQVRQQAGKVEPGTTFIRVDVVRPSILGEDELIVESGVTSITWSAPALTIVAKGPESAPLDMPFNYRLEISNPGDQTSRSVIVKSDSFGDDVKFISSNPKPAVYGKTLQWELGDIAPGTVPRVIDIQMKADSRGMKRSCFEVYSSEDQLKTEACAETEVAAPCIGLKVDGPSMAAVGQQATFNIEVYNQCDDALEDVRVEVAYQPGLSAPQLGNPIAVTIGQLQFGEKRTLPLIFDVVSPGAQCFTITVTSREGHTAGARRCIEASQGAVGSASVTVDGNRLARVNDTVLAKARIINTGNVPLNGLQVINKFSPSLEALRATDSINRRFVGDDLLFLVGRLDPGQEVIIDVEYRANTTDGNAFSQFSIVEPVQVEDKLPIRIDPLGNNMGAPPNNNLGGGGNIGIPGDQVGEIAIDVRAGQEMTPPGQNSFKRVAFDVRNTSNQPIRNVAIKILVPPGTQVTGYDPGTSGLQVANVSDDQQVITLETLQVLRPGETVGILTDVMAFGPGEMVYEVVATSPDVLGTPRGTATMRFGNQ